MFIGDMLDYTLITAPVIIDGTSHSPILNGAVLIQDSQIVSVGEASKISAPDGSKVKKIEYPKSTLLPGLVDSHVHLIGVGDGRTGDELVALPDGVLAIQASRNARKHLYSGVTTVRDCGARNGITFDLRESMEHGFTPGPRLVLSGRPIAIVGGHLSYFGQPSTGVVQCQESVRQLVKEGADFIKITATGGSTKTSSPLLPSFNLDELESIVSEAHKFQLHVAAHCTSTEGMRRAFLAGVDTIIHAMFFAPDGEVDYDQELVDQIAEKGVFVNHNLAQTLELVEKMEILKKDFGLSPDEEEELEKAKYYNSLREVWFGRMKSSGVTLVAGSDSAWSYYPMGEFYKEIIAHFDYGMTAMEAIVSATLDAAKSCCVDDIVGSIEHGKNADLVVIDGNPLEDINSLSNALDVFKDGVLVDRSV